MRIYIGTESKTLIAQKVLEYSIVRRASVPVELVPMVGSAWEYPTGGIPVGTGFSFRRWMIPRATEWEGTAIYLDADQLVLHDIAELAELCSDPTAATVRCSYQPDKFSATPWPQTSVMWIDCEKAGRDASAWGFRIDQLLARARGWTKKQYADFMHGTWLAVPPARLPTRWNHLNVYEPGNTRLLHYTKEDQQPWYYPKHPQAGLWREELKEAIRNGYIDKADFAAALGKWGVKEDWRPTNGLHPSYADLLPLF